MDGSRSAGQTAFESVGLKMFFTQAVTRVTEWPHNHEPIEVRASFRTLYKIKEERT